jgi:transcriptional regulator with XRE-family HTH domain
MFQDVSPQPAEKSMNKRAIDPQPGERLRQLRLHREISQGRIARVIGVTVGTIQNYEHGRAGLGVDRIEQLARALQCEPVELLAPPGSPLPRYWDSSNVSDISRRGRAPPLAESESRFRRTWRWLRATG